MGNIISVIVPVYNVNKYLAKCVESILQQTYIDLEIILIDDGSTDNSGEICDRFASIDSRIKVIHQQNGGAASAKNAGLRAATGKYLAFVDSDDYIECDAFEFMVNEMEQNGVDVVRCCFRDIYRDESVDRWHEEERKIYSANEFLALFLSDWTCGLLWDKLYVRKIYDGIMFEEGRKIDDEFFTYRGIMNAEKILSVPKIVYNYRKRKSSVMLSEQSKGQIVQDQLDYINTRRRNVLARFPDLKNMYDVHFANALLLLAKEPYVEEKTLKQIKYEIKDFLAEKPVPEIGFKIGLKLRKVQCTSVKRLFLQKKKKSEEYNSHKCFD